MFDLPLARVKDEVKVISIFDFAFDRDQMCNKSNFSCRECPQGPRHGVICMIKTAPCAPCHSTAGGDFVTRTRSLSLNSNPVAKITVCAARRGRNGKLELEKQRFLGG